jgi:hypothetical protein
VGTTPRAEELGDLFCVNEGPENEQLCRQCQVAYSVRALLRALVSRRAQPHQDALDGFRDS